MEKDFRPSIPSNWATNTVFVCIVCMFVVGLWMVGDSIQELQKGKKATQHAPPPVEELVSVGTRQ